MDRLITTISVTYAFLDGQDLVPGDVLEWATGIEPAWNGFAIRRVAFPPRPHGHENSILKPANFTKPSPASSGCWNPRQRARVCMVGTDGFEPPRLLEPGLQPGAIGLSATSPCTCTRQRPRAGLLELSPASSRLLELSPAIFDRKNVPGPLQGLSSRGEQTGSPPGHQVWKHAVVVRIPSHANPLHNHDQAQR